MGSRAGSREESINVHAKVIIMDDDLVRVGSSNLTNRSMGLENSEKGKNG
jgi:phosphatidylserine/phosphatidylglycerophosphate/cardiolipin synthase-like enzyme